MRLIQAPLRRERELRDRVVHLGADAICASDLPEHLGGLGAHRGREVVDENAYEGHCCLLALCRHSGELQGPVVL